MKINILGEIAVYLNLSNFFVIFTPAVGGNKLYLLFRRTTLGQRFITYYGIKLWNEKIPENIK